MNVVIRIYAFALVLSTCLGLSAQKPTWTETDGRNALFPAADYYTGYAIREIEGNAGDAVNKATADAMSSLSSAISTEVTAVTRVSVAMSDNGDEYRESESLESTSDIMSSSMLADVGKEIYIDRQANTVHVMVYVSRNNLLSYYDSTIEVVRSEALARHSRAMSHIRNGDKSEALKEKQKLEEDIMLIRKLFKGYTATSGSTPDTSVMTNLEKALQEVSDALHRGILICFRPDGNPGQASLIIDKLKGTLSHHGCTFVSTPAEADFIATVSSVTRSGEMYDDIYHSFADVNIKLRNLRKNVEVYNDVVTAKGSALSDSAANRKAIENSVNKITEKIINVIKQ